MINKTWLTIIGVLVSIFGALNVAQVITLFGPGVGAGFALAGAVVTTIGPTLIKTGFPHGLGWAGVAAAAVGALTASDILPHLTSLVGMKGAATITMLGLVLSAIAKGWGETGGAP